MEREELEKLGFTKEQIDSVLDMHHAEIDPVNSDLQKAQDDLKAAQGTVETQETTIKDLKKDLEEFKDADVSGMKQKITDLETDLENQKKAHEGELANRDFQALVKDGITAAKGKDADKIMKLLDVDTLKASKNQKEDVAAAIKALAEDDVTKGMFGEAEPQVTKTGSIIGAVVGGGGIDAADAQMRAVMGLPPLPNNTDK